METAKELLEDVKMMMEDSGVSLMKLSRESGVGYNTLRRIKAGEANPTVNLLDHVRKEMLAVRDNGKTCEDCRFCGEFDTEKHVYMCEIVVAAKDDPRACVMHSKEDTDA